MSQRQLDKAREILSKLERPNSFVEDIEAPSAIGVALSTGRPELLKLYNPTNPVSPDEAKKLVNIIRVLFNTNQALQEHAQLLSEVVDNIRTAFNGLDRSVLLLKDVADFRMPIEEDHDENSI